MRLDDLTRDEQAQAEPPVMRGYRALELLEDPCRILAADADAVIDHLERDRAIRGGPADPDRTTSAVLERVEHEVRDHLIDAQAIPANTHRRDVGHDLRTDLL